MKVTSLAIVFDLALFPTRAISVGGRSAEHQRIGLKNKSRVSTSEWSSSATTTSLCLVVRYET